ncbi:aspartate kinase [Candidatus Bipolaricaulota bacterium]|nr:aspartate kinase [Candidatus Bipolaricaulota bacterium]
MTRIVKKFGGTSLQTEERIKLAVEKVIDDLEEGNEVISVVSALGRGGDPYATDTLIELMRDVSPEIDPLKQDLMMSCGEVISASLFSHYLDVAGYDAVPMTGYQAGILTDREFGDARICEVDTGRMDEYMARGKSVVLAGFQGRTSKGEVTTLGRGGSDTTALKVGGAVNADRVEVYTDVPGVAVVDPGRVNDPPFFEAIPRDALLKLSASGSNIIHPRAVSAANEYEIPFSIKCSWGNGETLVNGRPSSERTPLGISVMSSCGLVKDPGFAQKENSECGKGSVRVVLEGDEGEFYLVREKAQSELSDFDPEPVSLVTAVSTLPDRSDDLFNRAIEVVGRANYVEKKVEPEAVQFVVKPEMESKVVRRIYDLFY